MTTCWEYNITLHLINDLHNTIYNDIMSEKMYSAMAGLGIPEKLVNVAKACLEKSRNIVRLAEKLLNSYAGNSELGQRDAVALAFKYRPGKHSA